MLDTLEVLFEDCADAIREKTEKTEKMKPSEMASNIKSIVSRPPVASGEYYQPVMGSEGVYPATASIMFFGSPLPASRLKGSTDTQFITLLEDVVEIPNYFLQNCTSINDIEIEGNLTRIGYNAFENSSLKYFYSLPIGVNVLTDEHKNHIPETMTTISNGSFKNATQLNPAITMHDGIEVIEPYAFALNSVGTTVKNAELPTGLTSIGREAFSNQQIAFTKIPAGVSNIEYRAFYQNLSLTTLTFEGKPSYIDSSAFASCNALTTINVPWAQNAVSGAPWGATNATINYNYTA